MPARNNRWVVTLRCVTRKAVAMEQLSKHLPAEKNSRNNSDIVYAVRAEGL
jgi:hypothetical protein